MTVNSADAGRRSPVGALRMALAIVLATISIVGPVSGPPLARAVDAPSFVILLDGLCSELPAGASLTAAFAGPGGLADRLVEAGWPATSIATFGYRGGSVDGAGRWRAAAYGCEDSRDQSLASDVDRLAGQLTAIATAHPGTALHLVGFSAGGLVAFGYLARTIAGPAGAGPAPASVTTLDSPLGGAPFVELLCGFAPDVCGGSPIPAPDSAFRDMSAIWESGSGQPAGARRSVASRTADVTTTNQAVAEAAAARGIEVLTVGNTRDWLYAPAGANAGALTFLDSQWLTTDPRGAGVHSRSIDSGAATCAAQAGSLAASYACNHELVTRDDAVGMAVLAVLAGATPALAASCPAGQGGCLSLPPRPPTVVSSRIAAGIVTGGGKFGTSAVKVKSGRRATILFATTPPTPGATLLIWGRTANGYYRPITTRVADARGVVRYYTPPISSWVAIQARYMGNYVNGPGISPGRVVTIR